MAIDPDIRDQAYQFFIQEAPELLQTIETELLTLRQDRNTAKVHNLMRAAHSIKGGAASVGLDAIKTLAHRLEDIFKALHHETLKIDSLLETSLLQAYDCLRSPLMEEVTLGYFDAEQVMTVADPVFTQLEALLDEFLGEAASLPSSIELGIDITLSIFEVDVSQGLERLAAVLAKHHNGTMAAELRAQAEVFVGIAELLSLPGFGTIAQATLAALNAHPQRALEIAQLALIDFYAAQQAVIAGDRSEGGAPSVALIELANLSSIKESHFSVSSATELEIVEPHLLSSLDTIWSDLDEEEILLPSLEGTWDDFATDFQELTQAEDFEIELPSSPVGIVSDYVSTLSSNEASSNQETIGANPQPQIEEWVQSVEQAFDSLPSIVTPDTATPVDTNLKPKPVELETVESAIAPIASTLKHDQKSRKSLTPEAPPPTFSPG
ncbi:Hpt domain-containing protein [Leptolyngbya sp. FACHB-541]|nr:Hpt domain-containing protein [Leptolyngbya sp. FACHB-541]